MISVVSAGFLSFVTLQLHLMYFIYFVTLTYSIQIPLGGTVCKLKLAVAWENDSVSFSMLACTE